MAARTHSSTLGALLGIFACLASCGVTPKNIGKPQTTASDETIEWRETFPPVRLKVHPLSRISREGASGDLRIEAHVELIDEWEHLSKGLGEFRFEIETLDHSPVRLLDGSQLVWRIKAFDPASASAPFDPITRTYRFVLTELAPGFPGESAILKATFSRPDGSRLFDERIVVVDVFGPSASQPLPVRPSER